MSLPEWPGESRPQALDTSTARVKELEADLAVDALPAREEQIKAQRNQVAADRASLAEAEWT